MRAGLRDGDGRRRNGCGDVYCSAFAPGLQNGLGHFLDEQRDAVSALDDVFSDAGGQRLVADDAVDHDVDVALRQPIDREECHMRSPDPRRCKLGPEGHDQQHAMARNAVNRPTERLQARGVGPVHILDDHQHRIGARQDLHL
jgi:hypothetical protein